MSRQFFGFGIYSLQYMIANPQTRGPDPFNLIFPKMTKCTFHTYGPSGTIQNHDALCVLPINILNEKIYFMAWFMLFGLCIFTLIHHIVAAIKLPMHRNTVFLYAFLRSFYATCHCKGSQESGSGAVMPRII